jgi:hypothetical protein
VRAGPRPSEAGRSLFREGAIDNQARSHYDDHPGAPLPLDVRGLNVVIAHDFMETLGGAERATQKVAAAFPDAPVVAKRMGVGDCYTSLLPPSSLLMRCFRALAPLSPTIVTDSGCLRRMF